MAPAPATLEVTTWNPLKMSTSYPTEIEIREAVLARAGEFQRITGASFSDVGKRALNDTALLFQIASGRNIQLATYSRLMTWFDANWPADSVPVSRRRIPRSLGKKVSSVE